MHGGGKLATQLSTQLGIETKIIEGRRITDAETLKVATMVYAGWINKRISAKLNSQKCKAIGLSGADLFLIPSKKRKRAKFDFGFVGHILGSQIKIKELEILLNNNFVPVIAPITATKNKNVDD